MGDAHSEPSQKKKWVKRILLILLILFQLHHFLLCLFQQ